MPDYIIIDLVLLQPERLRQQQQRDILLNERVVQLHAERLRQCSSVMPNYMIRELELLHQEPLRHCSSVMLDYMIRELELLNP
jgi:hypothetical protein